MKHMEIECKWEANSPHAFDRARRFIKQQTDKIPDAAKLHITDAYLDHAGHDLAAQKIALRVRNTDGKWEATYKTRSQIQNGKAVRQEETLPLPKARNLTQALASLAQKKVWNTIDVTELIVKFVLVNKRTIYLFRYNGAVLEAALDDAVLRVAGRKIYFKEIELELKRGSQHALDDFAEKFTQQTQLKRAEISKVQTAETLLDLWKN